MTSIGLAHLLQS